MPSTVEQLNPTRVKLTIELPFAELQPKIDEAYKQISQQVNLPGFRRGKVPPRLIDQRFGREAVLNEAINNALPDAYAAAITENKLSPLGQPEIEVSKLEDGELVEFTAEVDVRPDFELPDFSTISVEVDAAKVTDEDVQERVDLLRERFSDLHELDRAAAEGDVVNFDLSATQNGEPVDDAESHGMQYRIGAGGMIDGLDDALTGMKAGDEKTFTSKLAGGPHRDEDADIQVKVNTVNERELPEVDDDFAQLVSEFDTADEMLADLRENLERLSRMDQANSARDKVLEAVLEKTDFELPQSALDADIKSYHDQIENQLNQAGLTVEQYLADAEDEEANTPEEFWKEIDERAEQALRAQIVLDKLAEDQEIGVSQEEFTQLLFQKAQQNGTSPEQEIQHMTEHNHMPEWMAEVRRGKALGQIVDAATITDTDGAAVDLSRLQADGTLAPEADAEANADAPAEDAPVADAPAEAPAAEVADAPEASADEAKAAAPAADADEAPADDDKPAEKATTAKKAPAKKPAAKKTTAKKTTAKKTTTKASTAKSTTAKSATAKTTKTTKAAPKKTAAKKATEDKADKA